MKVGIDVRWCIRSTVKSFAGSKQMREVFGLRYYAFLLTLVFSRRCSGKHNTYSVMALDE